MDDRARNPMRFLAPLALIAATLVFLVVIAGAIGGGEEESAGTEAAGQAERDGGQNQGGNRNTPKTYEVQEGDTLDGIAAETGVSVEQIEKLNPDLDPQSLIAGQELRLRK